MTTVFSERLGQPQDGRDAGRRPRHRDRRCSTRSRASPTRRPASDYLSLMRANLAALAGGERAVEPDVRSRLRDGAGRLGGRPVLHGIDLTVRTGRVRGPDGRQRLRQVDPGPGRDRPAAADGGSVALFGTPLADFREWHRIGFVPQRATAASGVPASVREVVAAGRLGRRRLFVPLVARRPAGDRRRARRRRAGRPRAATAWPSCRAASSSGCSSPGRWPGSPTCSSSTSRLPGSTCANQRALADALRVLKARGATVVLVAHELGPMAPLVDRRS